MNISNLKKQSPSFFSATIIIVILFSIIFLWIGTQNSIQSKPPMIAGVSFEGEYRIGNEEWRPITKGEYIPADKGDITLSGIFVRLNPETGETIGPLPVGSTVNLYFNHIGGIAILPGGGKIIFDAENDVIGEDACAVMWGTAPATGEDPITIVLHNPHKFGNKNAINDFFENMSVAPGIYFDSMMLQKGAYERNIGILIFIISIFIMGISVFSTIIHIKYSKEMWMIGLMSFFAGCYFMFDAFAVSIWNEPNIFNTRALGLCMMLYMVFVSMLIVTQLENKRKKVGILAASVSAFSLSSCVAFSFSDSIKFFDTWLYWAAIETIVALVLILCQIVSFRKSTNTKKVFYSAGIITQAAFLVDFIAIAIGWWDSGFLSKIVFVALLMMMLIIVLRIIPSHINAAVKARALEAEKQALQLELQESRISIMLSQMQPHFIFNTLNTIYHLCDFDPKNAKKTISAFSKYLRNNVENLNRSEMIHFDKELSFVKTYLDVEKVRFDDELQIIFDIKATNFKLPVLTIQPIVENAVKHGTSKKEGVSSLCISTKETDTYYEIKVTDTGVGFDTSNQLYDEHKHIGINNVRQRLKHLCDGTLTIESTIGEGTTAIITIPKKEQ